MTADDAPVPRTRFERGSIIGKAVVRAAQHKLRQAVVRPFQSEEDRAGPTQTDDDIARVLFEACGALRGTALKMAQVLSTEAESVPEAYRAEFSKAAYRAPPINRALVQKIVRTELGPQPFSHFQLVPFAAASLGQVHAAESHDGEELAVKVQYPGMRESVQSDLALLRVALAPTRYGRWFAGCLDEVRACLAEELDYRIEARNARWFRDNLREPRVWIPRVDLALTTSCVLTTSRLDGKHLDEWLGGNPTREARDQYGQLLVELFHRSVFELGRLHADPNWGNYLFRDDGRLGLLDFGCVRSLEPELVASYRSLIETSDLSSCRIQELHEILGVHYRPDLPRGQVRDTLKCWWGWLSEPYRHGVFDFSDSDAYFDRGAGIAEDVRRVLDRYDGQFLYFGRAHHGLMRLLQRLGARVEMNRRLR